MARTGVIVLGLLIGVFLGVQLLNLDLYNTQMAGFKSFTTEDEYQKEFIDFMAKYKKSYKTQGEFSNRFQVFKSNYDWIQHTNSKNLTYTVGVNQFADLTLAEFQDQYTGKREKSLMERVTTTLKSTLTPSAHDDEPFPDHDLDWVKQGKVGTVKNQKNCGSCWAFSAIGVIEGRYAIEKKMNLTETGTFERFSEQQLVDCARDDPRWPNLGCNGGEMFYAFNYYKENKVCTAREYPYWATDSICKQDRCDLDKSFKVKRYFNVTSNSRYSFIRSINHGPVAVGVCASQVMMFYSWGIMTVGCGTCINHGVLATGYGMGTTVFGGKLEYVKLKNSWGAAWGEHGYIRVGAHETSGEGNCGMYIEPVQVHDLDL